MLELALVAIWSFLVAVVGGLLGLVLGNIRLPVLLLVGASPAAVAGANLAVSGVTAAAAAVGHVRAGRIDWRLVRAMAAPSIGGAVVGGIVGAWLPADILLAGIGVLLLWFGVDLLRPRRHARPVRTTRQRDRWLLVSSAWIGLLGGMVGLILGALRMPALLRAYPEQAKRMVGTNLTVGVLVGVAGSLAHAPTAFDGVVFAVAAGASVPGALLGARLTGRISDRVLVRCIAVALLVGGSATLARGAPGLA